MALTLKILGSIMMLLGAPIFTVTLLAVMGGNMQSLIAMGLSAQAMLVGLGFFAFGTIVQCAQVTAENSARTVELLNALRRESL